MAALTLYFDRNFGKRFPQALRKLGLPVQFQHDKPPQFPQNTPDDTWLAAVGKKGWIVCSHDRKFHLLPAELAALQQHGVGCFYLWGANASPWEKARSFARAYDRILEAVANTPRPFVFQVSAMGTLRKVSLADISGKRRSARRPVLDLTIKPTMVTGSHSASPP